MHGHEGADTRGRDEGASTGRLDGGTAAQDCPRRGGAETHEHLGLDRPQLLVEPGPARLDLVLSRALVDAALAALLTFPLEVLHRIRDVDTPSLHARLLERLVEETARWPHEGTSRQVLLVARLLAHEHHARRLAALAEHGLRGPLVEVAGGARRGFPAQHGEGQPARLLFVEVPIPFRAAHDVKSRQGSCQIRPSALPAGESAPPAIRSDQKAEAGSLPEIRIEETRLCSAAIAPCASTLQARGPVSSTWPRWRESPRPRGPLPRSTPSWDPCQGCEFPRPAPWFATRSSHPSTNWTGWSLARPGRATIETVVRAAAAPAARVATTGPSGWTERSNPSSYQWPYRIALRPSPR